MMTNTPLLIERFNQADQPEIKRFVVGIQTGEFNLSLSEEEQPDLIDMANFFLQGGFWTAKLNGTIVGTIGLQRLSDQTGVLRKMFVDKAVRGKEFGLAQRLLKAVLDFARLSGIKAIWLDTPAVATVSHSFYERNGFQVVDKANLPTGYTFPDNNSKVYKRVLS